MNWRQRDLEFFLVSVSLDTLETRCREDVFTMCASLTAGFPLLVVYQMKSLCSEILVRLMEF